MQRHNLPGAFQAANFPTAAAAARLTWPVHQRWAVECRPELRGLNSGIHYREGPPMRSSGSSGIFSVAVAQIGVGIRRTNLWAISPRLSLDAAVGAAYGWLPIRGQQRELVRYSEPPASTATPTRHDPVVAYNSVRLARGLWLANLEALVRYELPSRRFLLLTVGYHAGLRRFAEVRSSRAAYLDADQVIVREGHFEIPNRGSYATVQVGYGWQLASAADPATRWRTPRYPIQPEPDDEVTDGALEEEPTP